MSSWRTLGMWAAVCAAASGCSFLDDFDRFRVASRPDAGADGGSSHGDGGAPADDGGLVASCAGRVDGTACGSGAGLVCISGACAASTCGDGFLDLRGGEQCEDGNAASGDGCEPVSCRFSCDSDDQCDNGRPCDGAEKCASHVCRAGEPQDDLACTPLAGESGKCADGYCVPAGCGDGQITPPEQCDGGEGCQTDCRFGCIDVADCDDKNPCTQETCMDAGQCVYVANTAECADEGDACTSDRCAMGVCGHALIDADRDGFAPGECGPGSLHRGGDCNDAERAVSPEASETCDGADNDCDDQTDEGFTIATCYPDADRDGFPLEERAMTACSCPGGTLPERSDGAWDCWDEANDRGRDVFPGQTEFFAAGYNARCKVPGDPCEVVSSFDFDCDGEETPSLTLGNIDSCGVLSALSCTPSGYAEEPPACGVAAPFVTCTPAGGVLGGCTQTRDDVAQSCR